MTVPWPSQPPVIRVIVLICVAFEVVAIMAQIAGFGAQARNLMLVFGGFWPELLTGTQALYPGQPVVMFVTSAVLHGGLLHLFMNMVGLLWLGPMVIDRAGPRAFLPIIGLSALGAGLAYTLLSADGAPVVGASGVLFGLVGVLGGWELLDRLRSRSGLRRFFEQALAFIGLNVALALLAGGVVAWQAHLGGLCAGLLCGAITWPGGAGRAPGPMR